MSKCARYLLSSPYLSLPATESCPGMTPTTTFVANNSTRVLLRNPATLVQFLTTTFATDGFGSSPPAWPPINKDPPDVVATQPQLSTSWKTSPDPYPCAVLSANAMNCWFLPSMAAARLGLRSLSKMSALLTPSPIQHCPLAKHLQVVCFASAQRLQATHVRTWLAAEAEFSTQTISCLSISFQLQEWHGNVTGALFFFAVPLTRLASALVTLQYHWQSPLKLISWIACQADSAGLPNKSHISGIQLGLALLQTVAGPGPVKQIKDLQNAKKHGSMGNSCDDGHIVFAPYHPKPEARLKTKQQNSEPDHFQKGT